MSILNLTVDTITRKLLDNNQAPVFVINDVNVNKIRFGIQNGFPDIDVSENTAFRVMYIPPGTDKTVLSKTLSFYTNNGLYSYYDWDMESTVFQSSGILTVALCIFKNGTEVQGWHTVPYQIFVAGSIHTDDGDSSDETITPTALQRIAAIEADIIRLRSAAASSPLVVDSIEEMTDQGQIYVLTTDGNWYWYNGAEWHAGGTYGTVSLDASHVTYRNTTVEASLDAKADETSVRTLTTESIGDIRFVRPEGAGSSRPFEVRNGRVIINGSMAATLTRIFIYGSKINSYTAKPTYAAVPGYYYSPIESFIEGHVIKVGLKLISGSYVLDDSTKSLYVDLRSTTSSDAENNLFIGHDGAEWTVTHQPEMVCFGAYKGTYDNAVFEITFTDVTAIEEHPVTLLISESLDKINDQIDEISSGIYGEEIIFTSGDGISTTRPISKVGNRITINGTLTADVSARVRIYGDFATAGGQPTYTKLPDWYGAPIDTFAVNSLIKPEIKLVSGTYEQTVESDIYFDFRTADQSMKLQPRSGEIIKLTALPEMICIGFRDGTYDNAVFEFKILDVNFPETSLPGAINILKEKVGMIDEVAMENLDFTIPTYFEDQLDAAIAKVNLETNVADYDAFIFITDLHWYRNKKHSPAILRELLAKTAVQTVVCGGDIVHQHWKNKSGAINQLMTWDRIVSKIGINEYYCVFGNHDNNSNANSNPDTILGSKEIFGLLYNRFAHQSNVHWAPYSTHGDYYVDHDLTKTRYICLDWKNTQSYGQRGSWLRSILDIDDGYRVIIFHHGIYEWDRAQQAINPSGYRVANLTEITDLYPNKIVAIIQGHTHADAVFTKHMSPVIITSCDTWAEGTMTPGTLDEQCFDIVVVDYTNSVIHCTRIGRGVDRDISILDAYSGGD